MGPGGAIWWKKQHTQKFRETIPFNFLLQFLRVIQLGKWLPRVGEYVDHKGLG